MFDRYSVIDMFGPFYGENWYASEIADGLSFRWSGPERRSVVRAPTLGAHDLRLRWTFAILPQERQVETLEWAVNDAIATSPHWAVRGGRATVWTDVHLQEPGQVLQTTLTTDPRDDSGQDTRTLGLAVHKLEVFALDADTLGVEAQRLQQALGAREREIADLRNSTSWKLSRPLRWLKESLGGVGAPSAGTRS